MFKSVKFFNLLKILIFNSLFVKIKIIINSFQEKFIIENPLFNN